MCASLDPRDAPHHAYHLARSLFLKAPEEVRGAFKSKSGRLVSLCNTPLFTVRLGPLWRPFSHARFHEFRPDLASSPRL